jgi:hypothetical protein
MDDQAESGAAPVVVNVAAASEPAVSIGEPETAAEDPAVADAEAALDVIGDAVGPPTEHPTAATTATTSRPPSASDPDPERLDAMASSPFEQG